MVRILFLIFSLIGCIRSPRENKGNCKDINEYVQMKVDAANEVYMGDSLDLNISFINISDSLITFYPKGFIRLWKPSDIYFGMRCSGFINLIRDFRTSVTIQPGEKYLSRYAVKAAPPCFQYGTIDLQMGYMIQYEKEANNELCGRIESNIIKIRVKGELDR